MKRTVFSLLYLFIMAGLFVACDDDDDDMPVYGEAELVSFGFYAEDNQEVLLTDYVATSVGQEIRIALPDYVDKTALVARFEATENDVVTVGEEVQVSGETANDFSTPVDYVVTEGTNNSMYTVVIDQLPDAVWGPLTSDATNMREIVLKVNPANQLPYIGFVQSGETTDDYLAGVLALEEGVLAPLGGLASEGRASGISLTFSPEGTPFISFADFTAEVGQSMSAMTYNSGAWSYVGGESGKGITDVRMGNSEIVLKNDGNPFVFAMNNAAGALIRRELNISEYDGSSWSTSVAMPGRASDMIGYIQVSKNVNGVVYLTVYNQNVGSISVYSYADGAWTTLSDDYRDENSTGIHLRDLDMDVDADGNVYVAVADNALGDDVFRPKVMRLDAETGSWSNIGSAIDVDFATTREFSLALSPMGVPHLMFRDTNLFPAVVGFDEDAQDWTSPVVLSEVESSDLSMAFAANGVAYAIFTSANNDQTNLYKYDVPVE
ncbi:hypothetical protein [Geofilum rhodophaeum]|uniref:hypothetical protein n=1 Tax=Geofilum rhodophaeum TaxID=1965019 RepID=UPI000B523871|nr:hypothetical protein [Geofilum rhodophaeum]